MIVLLSPAAEADMEEAYDFLEHQRSGLGDDFANQLQLAFRRIAEAPFRWPEIEPGFRRYRLARFRYGLIYRVVQDRAEIIAIWHLARRPGSWRANLE
jgi:toxin ParE1/3/4